MTDPRIDTLAKNLIGFSCNVQKGENVMIETVKGALHGEGTILRMYECFGKRTNITLTVKAPFEKAVFTSLMEDDENEAKFEGDKLTITMKPYEIVTIRLV